jgi:hypothetical protein
MFGWLETAEKARSFRDHLSGFYEQPFRIAARNVTNARGGPSTFFRQLWWSAFAGNKWRPDAATMIKL